jgi:hypothetical protein
MSDQSSAMQSMGTCCPPLDPDKACDILDFHYRLVHRATVTVNDRRLTVPVEVLLHVRVTRCPGPTVLGDLVYSTTLLPGEKVRLFTQDRRTRFSFDSATKVSYRNEQSSEERYFMASMNDFMSDVTVKDSSKATNTSQGSSKGHGETSGLLSSIFGSPSVDVSGSYNAASTSSFLRELTQHTSASDHRAELATRATNSVSVGEVQTRTHSEGETADHFESSSREFSNANRCHAVTYLFYQINKTQTIKFTLEAIERRVIDPAADTRITNHAFVSDGDVSAIPNSVLATAKDRLEVEQIGRDSVLAKAHGSVAPFAGVRGMASLGDVATLRTAFVQTAEPLSVHIHQEALAQVDKELVTAGLLTAVQGTVSPAAKKQFSYERQSSLPTAGLLVKGCLDDCDTCEPSLERAIELELQRKELENALLKKQIELLEKSQQYRCCPDDDEEAE